MIVKAKYAHGPTAAGRTKAGIRYVTHRPSWEKDGPVTRVLFDSRDNDVSKRTAYARIDMPEDRYHYRFVISPGGETAADLREIARDTMDHLATRLDTDFDWIAVEHRDHSAHPHVHVVAMLPRRLSVGDLMAVREEATRAYQREAESVRELVPDREAGRQTEREWNL